MSVQLVAIYSTPDDPHAFDAHYRKFHTPLAKKIPGLQSLTVDRTAAKVMGDADIYMVARMQFADEEVFAKAMASAENREAGKDLMSFAKGKVTLLKTVDG